MFKVNENYLKLPGSYLFSTIGKKVAAYKEANPDKSIISLGTVSYTHLDVYKRQAVRLQYIRHIQRLKRLSQQNRTESCFLMVLEIQRNVWRLLRN